MRRPIEPKAKPACYAIAELAYLKESRSAKLSQRASAGQAVDPLTRADPILIDANMNQYKDGLIFTTVGSRTRVNLLRIVDK